MMDTSGLVFLLLLLVAVFMFVVIVAFAVIGDDRDTRCEALGGIWVEATYGDDVCLDPSTVIDLEEGRNG